MTREEFVENVTCWYELIDFCYDYGCDYCEAIYDDEQKDDYFDEELVEMARNASSWQELQEDLSDIPTDYDFYIRDNYGEWRGADDDDFDNYKEDVLSWGDDREIWDEEDEDEFDELLDEEDEIDETWDEDEEDMELEEGCSLGELFTSSATKLQTIEIEAEKEREREEKFFEQFLSSAT